MSGSKLVTLESSVTIPTAHTKRAPLHPIHAAAREPGRVARTQRDVPNTAKQTAVNGFIAARLGSSRFRNSLSTAHPTSTSDPATAVTADARAEIRAAERVEDGACVGR